MARPYHIQFLTSSQINFTKWDDTVARSPQSRIYATSAWLNIMSPGWCALVCNDYEYVMPLTCKKKLGISYLAQPAFTQQLGIFSKGNIPNHLVNEFYNQAKKKFRYATIFVNHAPGGPFTLTAKKNYILSLSNNYNAISNCYQSILIKNLKKAYSNNLHYEDVIDATSAIELYKNYYALKLGLPQVAYERLKKLSKYYSEQQQCFARCVKNNGGDILAISLFFIDEKRIYNITSTVTKEGRKLEANRFLYDQLIREFCESRVILDFEGGNIAGIETFYKQFGAVNEPYYFLKWNELSFPFNIIKK